MRHGQKFIMHTSGTAGGHTGGWTARGQHSSEQLQGSGALPSQRGDSRTHLCPSGRRGRSALALTPGQGSEGSGIVYSCHSPVCSLKGELRSKRLKYRSAARASREGRESSGGSLALEARGAKLRVGRCSRPLCSHPPSSPPSPGPEPGRPRLLAFPSPTPAERLFP